MDAFSRSYLDVKKLCKFKIHFSKRPEIKNLSSLAIKSERRNNIVDTQIRQQQEKWNYLSDGMWDWCYEMTWGLELFGVAQVQRKLKSRLCHLSQLIFLLLKNVLRKESKLKML